MELKECKLGEIVIESKASFHKARIGHIVGLIKNTTGEVVPVVKFATDNIDGEIVPIHHGNIALYNI